MSSMDYAVKKKTIKDIDVKNKRVLVRVDLNVPLDNKLEVKDTTKINAVIPTIQYLLDQNASVILVSHLGRPKGKVEERMRLAPVAQKLEQRLNVPVKYVASAIGEDAEQAVKTLEPKQVLLLENIRFYPEEEKNDASFSKKLASYADVFVNDAFGTIHRAHASTSGVTCFLPSVAGLLVEKEIRFFSQIFDKPQQPFSVVLGGAKVSTKIGIIENLFQTVNSILIGGGMCFTFFKAMGYEIGKSLCEQDRLNLSLSLLKESEKRGVEILLPVDVVVTSEITHNAERKVVPVNAIPKDMIGVDIGPSTIALFRKKLLASKTVFWNGPMGVFEVPQFSEGTFAIARMMAELKDAVTLIGGGESVMAANMAGIKDKLTHVSTGGGATLEFLEGKQLPGIMALMDK